MGLEVAAAERSARGQSVCGDATLVRQAAGTTTIAMADGLGHGPAAAEAAVAREVADGHDHEGHEHGTDDGHMKQMRPF